MVFFLIFTEIKCNKEETIQNFNNQNIVTKTNLSKFINVLESEL